MTKLFDLRRFSLITPRTGRNQVQKFGSRYGSKRRGALFFKIHKRLWSLNRQISNSNLRKFHMVCSDVWMAVVQLSQDHAFLQNLPLKHEVLSNSLKQKSSFKPFFRFLSFAFRVRVKVFQAILVKHMSPSLQRKWLDCSSGSSEKLCGEPGKRSIYSRVGLGGVGWESGNS